MTTPLEILKMAILHEFYLLLNTQNIILTHDTTYLVSYVTEQLLLELMHLEVEGELAKHFLKFSDRLQSKIVKNCLLENFCD